MKLNLRGNSLGFIYLLGGNSRGLAMDDSKAVFDKAIAEASVVFNRTKTVYERAKQEAIRDFSRAGSINNAIREAQVKLDGGDSWGTN